MNKTNKITEGVYKELVEVLAATSNLNRFPTLEELISFSAGKVQLPLSERVILDVSKFEYLSPEFIETFQDHLDWDIMSASQNLPEDFIESMSDRVDWDAISKYQTLSEEFIEKHAPKLNWYSISRYQVLSEDFIRRRAHDLMFYILSRSQNFSLQFAMEYSDRVDWTVLLKKHKLTLADAYKIKDRLPLSVLYETDRDLFDQLVQLEIYNTFNTYSKHISDIVNTYAN